MKSMSKTSLYACGALQTLSFFVPPWQVIQLYATRGIPLLFCALDEEEKEFHSCLLHHSNIVFQTIA